MAWPLATTLEAAYRLARASRPPLPTRYLVAQLALECTLDITKAVNRLGYAPRLTYATTFADIATSYLPFPVA